MLKEKLIEHSKVYEILKKICRFAFQVFYNDISVEGKENIPTTGPLIFAPNHQNALMDALAIILYTKRQPVFMAKADIFSNSLTRKILYFLKIIPVYRLRDGKENLNYNDESFDIALRCLMNNNAVGIMPEGTDIDRNQLRPLKKGIARIALQAQEQLGTKAGVKIIPVGIHYSNYTSFRTNIHISFGPPIEANEFLSQYSENQQTALSSLKEAVAVELKKLMVNIDSDEYYELIYIIKEIASLEMQAYLNLPEGYGGKFYSEKIISDMLLKEFAANPALAEEFKPWVNEYQNTLKRLKLNNDTFHNHFPENYMIWDIIRYVFAIPFVIAGLFFNAIPAFATWFFSSRVKDTQYISSFKYAIGLVTFSLYYLLFLAIPFPVLMKLLFVVTMPVLGILSYDYIKGVKLFLSTIRFRARFNQSEPSYSRLHYVRTQIINKVKNLINPNNEETLPK
jgi:1-acyl-sn-glycerol-3-phosphate acyltransferase